MEEHIWASDSNSMLSSHLGRVINSLLSARSKKLEDAISRMHSGFQRTAGSLEEPFCFLRKYVSDAIEKGEQLDQILVPMIESSLKLKDSRHNNQVLILFNWLFQDELLVQPLAMNLANIIVKKDDRYISLGWCNLIRGLLDCETIASVSTVTGPQEKLNILLKALFPSISHLLSIIRNGSTLQDGFELPTRLAVAAADCILVLTEKAVKKASISGDSSIKAKSSNPDAAKQRVILASTSSGENKIKSSKFSLGPEKIEMGLMLWDLLDELIILVQRLLAWSRKSRPLHAKGLEQVLKWLQEIKGHCGSAKDEAGGNFLKSGVSLLSSCWKHYCTLLRLEDRRFSQCYMEILNQYISGIQFYMDDSAKENSGNKDGGIETRKFFLSCISLLLGRLDSKQFEIAISKHGLEVSRLLLSQLQCTDDDVIEGAVNILKATIFNANYSSTGTSVLDTREIVFPLLLEHLDERHSTARAIVMLTAEYCSMDTEGHCLQEIFKRLGSSYSLQRKNAMDVISELMRMSSNMEDLFSLSMRQDLAKNLLHRLGDEDLVIRRQASDLLPTFDPALTLPELVHFVYFIKERGRSSVSDALVAVLKYHNQNPEVIVLLLDHLSQLCRISNSRDTEGGETEGSAIDTDIILKLIPEWSKSVQDWNIFIEPLVDKMFAEPSNAIIVRFLSYISENLAEAPDVVLCRILLHLQRQHETDEKLLSHGTSATYRSEDANKLNLFDRLCPLLIIRLLPLRVFDNLSSSVMYGQLCNEDAMCDNQYLNDNFTCISALLVNRAFNKDEFEDVRKLAAELCGRVHPQVLYPIILSQLEHAIYSQDILKMKSCLFSLCTSLVLRDSISDDFPVTVEIRKVLETILLWPSVNDVEVSKAQHGCIDCLALMICAELQSPEVLKEHYSTSSNGISISGEKSNASLKDSVLNYVIERLTNDRKKSIPLAEIADQPDLINKFSHEVCKRSESSFPLSFHMCMANVLISACQKISSSGKKPLAKKTLPLLIRSLKTITESDIRAACIQVLFSAVYHLKSEIYPHSMDLLKLSIKALGKGSEKEKLASVKLMAALMASEDGIVASISGGLLEARSVLATICSTDPSMELRQLCQKLLVCISM